MACDLIHDRGRGPEIVGTRITVYNLLPHFLDPTATEAYICRLYELSPEQVSAARAYILNHADTVLARHLEIEARMAAGNPPQVIEQAHTTRAALLNFRDWLAHREQEQPAEPKTHKSPTRSNELPTFRGWLAEQEARTAAGS